jgi:hypothetical protein
VIDRIIVAQFVSPPPSQWHQRGILKLRRAIVEIAEALGL